MSKEWAELVVEPAVRGWRAAPRAGGLKRLGGPYRSVVSLLTSTSSVSLDFGAAGLPAVFNFCGLSFNAGWFNFPF